MSKIFVKLPTGDVEIEHIKEMYLDLNFTKFKFHNWKPRPALVDKSTKTSWLYTGQRYDSNYIDLVEEGWTHDHCEICYTMISNHEYDNNFNGGYFNGGIWVCKSCYELILSTKDLEKTLQEFAHYEN